MKTIKFLTPIIFLICFFHGVSSQKLFFFTLNPVMACRYMYFPNPFPESIAIADYIRNHTAPDSTIAVLGSEPQIYFYARRHSATSHIYTYSLMEKQKYAETMQKEMIAEIEDNKPEYIVFVKIATSWLKLASSNMTLFNWFKIYQKQYTLVGIIDIISPFKTKYLWDEQVQGYKPGSYCVAVFKRI